MASGQLRTVRMSWRLLLWWRSQSRTSWNNIRKKTKVARMPSCYPTSHILYSKGFSIVGRAALYSSYARIAEEKDSAVPDAFAFKINFKSLQSKFTTCFPIKIIALCIKMQWPRRCVHYDSPKQMFEFSFVCEINLDGFAQVDQFNTFMCCDV